MIEWLSTFLNTNADNEVVVYSFEDGSSFGSDIETLSNIFTANGLNPFFTYDEAVNSPLSANGGFWLTAFDQWKEKGYIL